ncbi:hypothetical protein BDZ94DRAFT_1262794 [Collybia nuda]|uniref:Uncharacterized protein n=1 Tax=Collybia nuda TaxID=64659 RepID=A0A9P5Y647_9AGAR|nr:hypothetical protein BDZ94DRAFT_1262794 [Collybia nuda]
MYGFFLPSPLPTPAPAPMIHRGPLGNRKQKEAYPRLHDDVVQRGSRNESPRVLNGPLFFIFLFLLFCCFWVLVQGRVQVTTPSIPPKFLHSIT